MPAKDNLNLLPKDQFENTSVGKLVNWSINVGRWIVVFTALIVICAFLSRFYFDTTLANLFDEIRIKKAMIDANTSFEEDYRQIQEKTKVIKEILNKETTPSALLIEIAKTAPLDLFLKNITITENKVTVSGYCLSEKGLRAFTTELKKLPILSNINISNLSEKDSLEGIEFTINADWKK